MSLCENVCEEFHVKLIYVRSCLCWGIKRMKQQIRNSNLRKLKCQSSEELFPKASQAPL